MSSVDSANSEPLIRIDEPTIKRAGELEVGVVAMCPVAGGVLAGESGRIKEALKLEMPTAAMSLRFVLSNPDISTACSGMNTIEQLEQNVKTAKEFDPSSEVFSEMCEGLDRLKTGLGKELCTGCRYCMPCPRGVDIPRYMEIYRNWQCFGLEKWASDALKSVSAENSLLLCNECGACEKKCPNSLQIRATL